MERKERGVNAVTIDYVIERRKYKTLSDKYFTEAKELLNKGDRVQRGL